SPHRPRAQIVSIVGAMAFVRELQPAGYEYLNHLTDQLFTGVTKHPKSFGVHVFDSAHTVRDDDAGGRSFQQHAESMFGALALIDLVFKIFGVLLNCGKALRALVAGDG